MQIRFDYKMQSGDLFLRAFILLLITFGFAYLAITNEKGIRFAHLVTTSVEQATMLIWLGSAIFLIGTLLMSLLAVRSRHSTPIILDVDHFIAPEASLKQRLILVPYKSITQIDLGKTPSNQKILSINSTVGQVVLLSNGFKSENEFLLLRNKLVELRGRN